MTLVHHVELWVPDLAAAVAQWEPVLLALGCTPYQVWDRGRSWQRDGSYVVLEQSTDLAPGGYDRLRTGLNHLALRGPQAAVGAALGAGWTIRIDTGTAVHLVDSLGFELEIAPTD